MTDAPDPAPATGDLDTTRLQVHSTGSSSGTTDRIGPYRMVEKIGEGGMGEVWLVEQTTPIQRRAALKLIKAGMDTREVIARFETERQALAVMDHPAIAKVFDAGSTPEGRPYFVMEYVQGAPITEYCDNQRLTTRERLELIAQVCEGVQHAHQKAIIHRDLKPSNVLITLQDGKAVPKIIDFGVAKATGQRLTEETMLTQLGVLVGTPEYMSPEQAEFTVQGIDTRTDIYSMGVMLYELLVGSPPFEPSKLRRMALDQILRQIREEEPQRPSTRVRTQGEVSTARAHNRRTEPATLARQLAGDLDWITMKALEKDRARRYSTASDMAADIRRYLRDEPIAARPPSAVYRTGKFVRRHRLGVALSLVAMVTLAVFAVSMAAQAARIARERDRANNEAAAAKNVSDFLTGLFKVSDPSEARGNSVTAREILDKGARRMAASLSAQPELQARLMDTMGRVYIGLGLYGQARPLMEQALATRRRVLGEDHPDALASAHGLGVLELSSGRYAEAERLLKRTLDARRRRLGAEHADTLDTISALGLAEARVGRPAEAVQLISKAVETSRRVAGPDHAKTLLLMNDLSEAYDVQGEFTKSEALEREVLERRRRVLGADHPDTIKSMVVLGVACMRRDKNTEAEGLFREALAASRRVNGAEHQDTLAALGNLGFVLISEGSYADAEKMLAEALDIERRALGADHKNTINTLLLLGRSVARQGRYAEAEKQFREFDDDARRVLGPNHPDTLLGMEDLATQVYAKQRRFAEAEKLLRSALASRESHFPNHPDTLYSMTKLAGVLVQERRYAEAEKLYRDELERGRRALGEEDGDAWAGLAAIAARTGKPDQAMAWLKQAVDKGFNQADETLADESFQSLRGDARFTALLGEMRKRAAAK